MSKELLTLENGIKLGGLINNLGYPGIINPARETLENVLILPLNVENGYPLRRDTREILNK